MRYTSTSTPTLSLHPTTTTTTTTTPSPTHTRARTRTRGANATPYHQPTATAEQGKVAKQANVRRARGAASKARKRAVHQEKLKEEGRVFLAGLSMEARTQVLAERALKKAEYLQKMRGGK